MRLPWSIEVFLKYRKVMDLRSFLTLRRALIQERASLIGFHDTVNLRIQFPKPFDVRVRPRSNDIYTIDEILIDRVYASTLECIPDARTILDLGANIGLASLYFASAYPAARLYAVEPDADNFRLVQRNLALLVAAGRAVVRRGAVWDRDVEVAFIPPESLGHVNQGTVSAVDSLSVAPAANQVCAGMRIATMIRDARFETVDLLKIDVEGAEVGLFADCQDWLPRVNAIAIEFHGESRRESGFDEIVGRSGFSISSGGGHTAIARRSGDK